MNPKQLTKEQIEEILKRNARRSAKSQVAEDVYALMEHIAWLERPVAVVDEEDLEHRCGLHHTKMYIVRPGQWACNECENEWFAEEIKNKGTATR